MKSELFQRLLVVSMLILLSGCQHAALRKEIVRLDADIQGKQQSLSQAAGPYRAVPGAGFQIDVSKTPVMDTLHEIDKVDSLNRTVSISSFDYGGYIAEYWTTCLPWPFEKDIGVYIKLARHDALQMVFHMGRTNPRWKENRGLEFDFDAAGAGGAVLVAGVKACFFSTHIGAFPVLAVLPPLQKTTGRLRIGPTAQGLEYFLVLDNPPTYFIGASLFGFNVGWPFKMDSELTSGVIDNVVGNEGDIQLSKIGAARHFVIDFKFDHAAMLAQGMQVSGPITVVWSTPTAVPIPISAPE